MTNTITVKVTQLNKTPVFVVSHNTYGIDFSAVFGATKFPHDPLHWYYPAYYPVHRIVADDLVALSKQKQVELEISEAARNHILAVDQYKTFIQEARLPKGFEFRTKPFQHQLDGLLHLVYNLRAALFYDCGTGKTKLVIDWQRAVGCWPLVICPRIAVHVWGKELKVHGIDQEYQPIDANSVKEKERQIEAAAKYHGLVVTYDTLRRHYQHIAEYVPYDAIVADESQKIKQSKSQRTKVALEMSKKAYRRVIMSGTPSLGDPRDVYPQYRFLAPYLMPWNVFQFKGLFCTVSPYNKHIVTGFKNLDMLNRRINLVSIRRKKEDCLDLPERTIQDLHVAMTPQQLTLYNELAHALEIACGADLATVVQSLVQQGKGVPQRGNTVLNVPHVAALINKLIQVSAGFILKDVVPDKDPCTDCAALRDCVEATPPVKPWSARCARREELGPPPAKVVERLDGGKSVTLADLLEDLLEEKTNKVIIWGQYIAELDIIEETVKKAGVKYVRVDGSNTMHAKKFESRFNDDPDCRVYVSQVATGVSITLNSAQYMVYFSLPWNLEHYLQSLDRNHRVGQTKNVTVYRLLAKGVDECIATALATKDVVANALIDEEASCRKVQRSITKVAKVEG